MKKKYFIRGFGMGVLFAAIVFGISYGTHNTDEQVIERAKELGMVREKEEDDDTLNLATSAPKEGAEASAAPEGTGDSGKEDSQKDGSGEDEGSRKGDVSQKGADGEKGDAPDQEKATKETPQPTPVREVVIQKTPKPSKTDKSSPGGKTKVAVEITSGMWSDTVALQLAEAGLIDDAAAFDKYLNQNGYASKIKTGSYQISPGLSYKEIAKMISGQ